MTNISFEKVIRIRKIILASGSPRRASLLDQIGIPYETVIPEIDESVYGRLPPHELVTELSRAKALSVGNKKAGYPVVAADTIVCLDREILGKPLNEEEAFKMLRTLSGRWHRVYTGITVAAGDRIDTGYEMTEVKFRQLSDREIEEYIRTGEPMDKAGAYGIQGKGALLVERINGDYYNVMGLPLARLWVMLNELGGTVGEGIL
jgi:septum formation protein